MRGLGGVGYPPPPHTHTHSQHYFGHRLFAPVRVLVVLVALVTCYKCSFLRGCRSVLLFSGVPPGSVVFTAATLILNN